MGTLTFSGRSNEVKRQGNMLALIVGAASPGHPSLARHRSNASAQGLRMHSSLARDVALRHG